jgi:hypothetical protein
MRIGGLLLFSFLTSLVVIAIAAETNVSPEPFAADKRLNKVISLAFRDKLVSDILDFASKATGAPLFADDEVKILRATLLLKDQTASASLVILADCLRLSWKKERNGYRLYCTPERSQEDQQRAISDTLSYARAQAQVEEKHRQLVGFVEQALARSHLTDDEVRQLASQYPYAAEKLEKSPWTVIAVRVASWLTPEQWEKAIDKGIWLDYPDWTLTGLDPDIPEPKTSSRIGSVYKPEGRSGIQKVYVRMQRDGTLAVAVQYRSEDGNTAIMEASRFGLGPLP